MAHRLVQVHFILPLPSPLSSKISNQNQAAAFGEGGASTWPSHGKYSGMSLLFLRDTTHDHASKSIALYFSVSNSNRKEPRYLQILGLVLSGEHDEDHALKLYDARHAQSH